LLDQLLEPTGPSLSAADLELTRALTERTIGRELRPAERRIDVLRLDRALEQAKKDVYAAILLEQRRAARRALRNGTHVRLQVTRGMLLPLERLFRLGREEALAELRRAGVTQARAPVRQYAHAHPHKRLAHGGALSFLAQRIRDDLHKLSRKVEGEMVTLDLSEASSLAIARALLRVPGGKDIASRVISTAMDRGFAQTFEENKELAGAFEYTAVLDGATCDPCDELDGTEYESWDAIQDVLPDGGPNPECEGGDRCRCRAVPLGAA